jgi:phosphate transport system protein
MPRINFQQQLLALKDKLLAMAALSQQALEFSVEAYMAGDMALCDHVLEIEAAINAAETSVDEMAYDLLAKEQPMAVDLRFILSVIKINGDLERIGDQAVNIAQSAMRILRHPQVKPYVDLPRMSELAEAMVRDSLNAVVRGDQELAQSVLRRDDQVDRLRDQLFRELLTYMMEDSAVVFAAFELVLVAKNLERIGDHATNIAEDVIYFVAGRDVRHPALDRR